MGDDRRVVPEAGTGDGGPERQRRPLAERAHERPGEGARALLRGPRVEVLADHEAGLEAGILGRRAVVQQLGRLELLQHRGVADLGHRGVVSGSIGREGGRRPQAYRVGRLARPRPRISLPGHLGDDFDLDVHVGRGQRHHADRARRDGSREMLRADGPDRRQIRHVREEDGDLDDIAQIGPEVRERRPDVREHLLGLGLDPAVDDLHRLGVRPGLAGEVEHLAHPGRGRPAALRVVLEDLAHLDSFSPDASCGR